MKMIILLALLIAGCNSVTDSLEDAPQGRNDTLYFVSTYPINYYHAKGGDSVGAYAYGVRQQHLDSSNGFRLTKIGEKEEGAGWDIAVNPYGTSIRYEHYFKSSPRDTAFWFDDTDCTWVKVSLEEVADSMETKGAF